jgi:hypothetical protein
LLGACTGCSGGTDLDGNGLGNFSSGDGGAEDSEDIGEGVGVGGS